MTDFRRKRASALDMSPDEFRKLGYRLVDQIANFYGTLPERRVTAADDRARIVDLIGDGALPGEGIDAGELLDSITPLLFEHSLHNGHPGFLGYISASGAPLGALADFLASAVNANLAKWDLSPVASEIETQTIRWLAELVGFPGNCGGIMVSGGNSANIHGFLAARRAMARWDIRGKGVGGGNQRLTAYASRETHTWIEKAADVAGLGTDALRWIECDDSGRVRLDSLRSQIDDDRRQGFLPFLVVGTAGTTGTGAVDPLRELSALCRSENIWFHVDGAYGAPAACLPEAPDDLRALAIADSVTLDPHKWLYTPIEAGCILTRNPDALRDAFDFRPSYYRLDETGAAGIDYYQHGMQNSRGFRALKVWLQLKQVGRNAYCQSIREDISLARRLYDAAGERPDFEPRTQSLSITTFRYRPSDITGDRDSVQDYLNRLNRAIATEVQKSGSVFISHAVVGGDYLLRACVVNFRTSDADIDAVVATVAGIGQRLHSSMWPEHAAA